MTILQKQKNLLVYYYFIDNFIKIGKFYLIFQLKLNNLYELSSNIQYNEKIILLIDIKIIIQYITVSTTVPQNSDFKVYKKNIFFVYQFSNSI